MIPPGLRSHNMVFTNVEGSAAPDGIPVNDRSSAYLRDAISLGALTKFDKAQCAIFGKDAGVGDADHPHPRVVSRRR